MDVRWMSEGKAETPGKSGQQLEGVRCPQDHQIHTPNMRHDIRVTLSIQPFRYLLIYESHKLHKAYSSLHLISDKVWAVSEAGTLILVKHIAMVL